MHIYIIPIICGSTADTYGLHRAKYSHFSLSILIYDKYCGSDLSFKAEHRYLGKAVADLNNSSPSKLNKYFVLHKHCGRHLSFKADHRYFTQFIYYSTMLEPFSKYESRLYENRNGWGLFICSF